VDLLKCDVEGGELDVLRGGTGLSGRNRPAIMLEMLRKWAALFGYHPDEIIRLLGSMGYVGWYADGGTLRRLAAMDDRVEAVNFFFLHAARHAAVLARMEDGMALDAWLRAG
jgi:hypothetical protein